MDVNGLIDSVAQELREESYSIGALLHGSFAAGTQHAQSDVDILCVTNTDWFSKEIREVEGVEVEIQRIPEEKVRADFARRLPTNNNFMLSIFIEGRILFDNNGLMHRLVQEAKEFWNQGPPKPSSFEVFMGRSFYRHRLNEVKRLVEGDDPGGLSRVMMGLLFHNSVYGYCKTHQKWAMKFSHLLESFRQEDPEFYELCTSYLASNAKEEGLKWLQSIVNAVMEPVGWGSLGYQTPQIPLNHAGQMRDGMLF